MTYAGSNITVTNAEGTTTIALADVQEMYFSNDAGDPTPGYIAGDVNADGEVNIGDVTALIDYLLNDNAAGINLQAADVQGDGEINIGDVTALIDLLLAGN